MTLEQAKRMKLTKKTKQPRISIQKLGPIGKAFQAGGNEVLNNLEKYNLMPIPTEEEIESFVYPYRENDDFFWSKSSDLSHSGVIEVVVSAFEHFKNRKS